jgi:hypothetical protein
MKSDCVQRDLQMARNELKKKDCALAIARNERILFETKAPGIRGLLTAVDQLGEDMKGASVADKIVGEAAAQLCLYSEVREAYAVTMSQCAKDLFDKSQIDYEYENLVPHILNVKKTDLCPFEKIVAGSKTPKEAYERLKKVVQNTFG